MPYHDGYPLAVPTANRESIRAGREGLAYLHAAACWGDALPDGKATSFPLATQTVAFSRVTTRDAGWNAMMDSPAMKMDDMPFDGMRITWRGFTEFVTARAD